MYNSTVPDLLESVAHGDEKSFGELFYHYKDRVYGYAMHFTRSVIASEEIVQGIFLKLWLHKEELSQVHRFEPYLYTATRNLCFDYLKKLAHEEDLKQEWSRSAAVSDNLTEAGIICRDYETMVNEALDTLPPQQRKIYTLSFYHGQKYEEIARYLNISRNTVKVHLNKARTAVRNYLATHIDLIVLIWLLLSCRYLA